MKSLEHARAAEVLWNWYMDYCAESPTDLAEYAMRDALDTLVDNWRCAISDGATIDMLLHDIWDVIANLVLFHKQAREELPDLTRVVESMQVKTK